MVALRASCLPARKRLPFLQLQQEKEEDEGGCLYACWLRPSVTVLLLHTMVRITTWNVNGIRNPFGYKPWSTNRTFNAMFDILETDIVIMQELKIQRKDLTDDMVLVPGWDCYFSLPKHKKGTPPCTVPYVLA